jgi:hypothetical protein
MMPRLILQTFFPIAVQNLFPATKRDNGNEFPDKPDKGHHAHGSRSITLPALRIRFDIAPGNPAEEIRE